MELRSRNCCRASDVRRSQRRRNLTARVDGYDAEQHRARTVLEKRAGFAPPLLFRGPGTVHIHEVGGSSPSNPTTVAEPIFGPQHET